MRKLLLLIFNLCTFLVLGQNVLYKGRVIDIKQAGLADIEVSIPSRDTVFYTDENGYYTVLTGAKDTFTLHFYADKQTIPQDLFIDGAKFGSNKNLPTIQFKIESLEGVEIIRKADKPFVLEKLEIKDWQILPIQNVEQALVFTTAARSSNELTSNYNVRGGNYDENLIYVNGFQIYRPFLTRAGQQEGMSFINSSLVESLSFSAGGFDAQYGDKMSSVLDINYRKPEPFRASLMASLLGAEAHIEQQLGKRKRFNYMAAGRFRSNGYFLNSMPVKGNYNPIFGDVQILTNYTITDNWTWSNIFHYSDNTYSFRPQTQKTDFGTVNQAYSFNVYFEGQEKTRFKTLMAATKFAYVSDHKKTKMDFYASMFNTDEREYFDVLGEYFINQLETNPAKESYGDSIDVLGIGGYLDHGRNRLRANVFNVYHTGEHTIGNRVFRTNPNKLMQQSLLWGLNFEFSQFNDRLSEWKYVDSAGYSLPQSNDHKVVLWEVIKGNINLATQRYTGHFQYRNTISNTKKNFIVTKTYKVKGDDKVKRTISLTDTLSSSSDKFAFNIGTRVGYTSVNGEFYMTPRMSLTYFPRTYVVKDSSILKRTSSVRFATGLYYQPPMYREMRTYSGDLNPNVLSQKSFHAILGYDIFFYMMGRNNPFKLTAEVFYKHLWDVNPYEVVNVRTRYYAENSAVAYATGIDLNLTGEFIEGISSFFKVGIMRTMEDLRNDYYKEYYNSEGEKIVFGYTANDVVVDSMTFYPGYVPRPTDQLLNIGMLIQDQMPGFEALSLQMGLNFGTGLPYGPPGQDRYRDTLRMRSYFRVDIGTSYDFLYNKRKREKDNFWNNKIQGAILSFEVYNLLGINNEMSKQWIQDVNGIQHAIPNYLTQRRFNLKLILRF